jgi:hypothetical protein
MLRDDHLMSMHGRLRDAGSRMAAAAEQSTFAEVEAEVREAEEQLQGATGDEKLEILKRLTVLEQQKLLLMQQQSGATVWHTARVLAS